AEGFAQQLRASWRARPFHLLDELRRTLVTCDITWDGRHESSLSGIDDGQLCCLCEELKLLYAPRLDDARLTKYPLLLFCMVLHTQEDVDI
ncbi:unnamed protein product, partial [Prorocentrum cordatum]